MILLKGADSYQNSSKMLLTMAIAKATRSRNEKLLIISHSIACLGKRFRLIGTPEFKVWYRLTSDYLENLLPMLGINVVRLDGNTPYEVSTLHIHSKQVRKKKLTFIKQRQPLIDLFHRHEDKHTMLLSAKVNANSIRSEMFTYMCTDPDTLRLVPWE